MQRYTNNPRYVDRGPGPHGGWTQVPDERGSFTEPIWPVILAILTGIFVIGSFLWAVFSILGGPNLSPGG
jgi:hypothetical protein